MPKNSLSDRKPIQIQLLDLLRHITLSPGVLSLGLLQQISPIKHIIPYIMLVFAVVVEPVLGPIEPIPINPADEADLLHVLLAETHVLLEGSELIDDDSGDHVEHDLDLQQVEEVVEEESEVEVVPLEVPDVYQERPDASTLFERPKFLVSFWRKIENFGEKKSLKRS